MIRRICYLFILILYSLFGITVVYSQSNFWQNTNVPGPVNVIAANSQGHILATSGSLTYRSTDLGVTWVEADSVGSPWYLAYSVVAIPGGKFIAGDYGDVSISYNEGNTWNVASEINNDEGEPTSVFSVAVTPDSLIFAGTEAAGIFYSWDMGNSWTSYYGDGLWFYSLSGNIKGHLFCATGNLFDINTSNRAVSVPLYGGIKTVLSVSPCYVYAGTTGNGVEISSDTGNTFIQTDSGLTESNIISLAADSDGNVFAGTYSHGVCRSTDHGQSWQAINSGLTDTVLYGSYGTNNGNITTTPQGYLFVSTAAGKIFRSAKPTITSVPVKSEYLPKSISLRQNYPNPFNPTTTISFTVPRTASTTLKIFNLSGQEVATLVSKNLTPGRYSFRWDAEGQPSGIYFYQLRAGNYQEIKKLVLLK